MQKNGEYTAGTCPYGYRKSEEDKRKLSVDPEAADVVKKIFEWCTQGKSNGWIAKALNELAVPSPGLYQLLNGNQAYQRSSHAKWNIAHISGILKNPVYLGHLAQGKSKRSYFHENGIKRRVGRENWVISENTHEPLVTQKQFDTAAVMAEESMKRYRRQQDANESVPHMENPLRRGKRLLCTINMEERTSISHIWSRIWKRKERPMRRWLLPETGKYRRSEKNCQAGAGTMQG